MGDDRFVFHFAERGDRISGFDFGSSSLTGNKIDLRGIDANEHLSGNQAFSATPGTGVGQLSFVDLANGNTLIRGNTSSVAGFELEIEVAGRHHARGRLDSGDRLPALTNPRTLRLPGRRAGVPATEADQAAGATCWFGRPAFAELPAVVPGGIGDRSGKARISRQNAPS